MEKRLFCAIVLALSFILPLCAQENARQSKSTLSYENIPVYKVLDGRDGYVVMYAKYGAAVGETVLPKAWSASSVEKPAKLVFRSIPVSINPYMTVVKKDGNFYKVILSVNHSRTNAVWGVVANGRTLEGTDKETLEIELK